MNEENLAKGVSGIPKEFCELFFLPHDNDTKGFRRKIYTILIHFLYTLYKVVNYTTLD